MAGLEVLQRRLGVDPGRVAVFTGNISPPLSDDMARDIVAVAGAGRDGCGSRDSAAQPVAPTAREGPDCNAPELATLDRIERKFRAAPIVAARPALKFFSVKGTKLLCVSRG